MELIESIRHKLNLLSVHSPMVKNPGIESESGSDGCGFVVSCWAVIIIVVIKHFVRELEI
jgi:hypothetical protein